MELKYKDMIKALGSIEEEHNISQDIDVFAKVNTKTKTIDLFQNYKVVEEVEDDELEISLADAKELDPNAEIDSIVSRQIEMPSFSRASATLTRNVMRQKIREAEKVAVYNEYIDQLHEMVLGVVESVKDKFTLVNIGRTTAVMPRFQEIPQERLVEGQQVRVVITNVSKDTKGSQVTVSRADPMLVRRLFEKEVPEIYNGVVEIKAIARDAGDRTKMAVVSHNPDVDPIGACIGPRGQRVQEIINELKGEKIDIFQWSDDITELVRNALSPAEIEAVLPGNDERSLVVVVDPDQLSLAIGKRGKNARLAVKLTDRKIDIKTREELEEAGYDYEEMLKEAEIRKEAYRKEAAQREIERMEAEAKAAEEKRLAQLQALGEKSHDMQVEMEEDGFIPEEMQEAVSEKIITDMAMEAAEEKPEEEQPAEEPVAVQEETTEETPVEEALDEEESIVETETESLEGEKKTAVKHRHADLESMAEKNTYVSKFEKLTDTTRPKQEKSRKKKRKTDSEDNYKVDNKELERIVKERLAATEQKPLYTDEELEEIEAERRREEERELGIDDDYDDEYDDYYEDEDQ